MAYTRSPAYQPGQKEVYKLSRSKIELYTQCPRCFWLEARSKIKRPSSPPFQINKAIDELLKKEFDKWRHNLTGFGVLHEPTNLFIFGAVDDIWVNDKDELIVVDYKATSKNAEITLDADWQIMYKRQMEIYQWLLRANGFKVSNMGYFVYTNARLDLDGFYDKLEFRTKVIGYTGHDKWVEPTIGKMKKCLEGDIPAVGTAAMGGICEFCTYAKARTELTLRAMQKK